MESNKIVDVSPKRGESWPVRGFGRHYVVWSGFALIMLASGIYFGPQTITYYKLRIVVFYDNDDPPRGWNSVPRPLADTAASAADGSTLSYYGYRFEVPWKEIDKEWNEGRWAKVRVKTGQEIRFNNPEYFQSNPLSDDVAKEDPEEFGQAFGTRIRESKYDQFKAVISTTPFQWSPFRSHREFTRVRILIGIEGLWFEHNTAAPDIFSFETNGYRGFEFSGLSHDWQNVTLDLFDATDRWFQINISGDARSGVSVTQSEVNRLIQTFGPAHSTQPNSLPK